MTRCVLTDAARRCGSGSSKFLELAAAASCSGASRCLPRGASFEDLRRPKCAQLPRQFGERGIQIEANASWCEQLLFCGMWLLAMRVVYGVAITALPRRRDAQRFRPFNL